MNLPVDNFILSKCFFQDKQGMPWCISVRMPTNAIEAFSTLSAMDHE